MHHLHHVLTNDVKSFQRWKEPQAAIYKDLHLACGLMSQFWSGVIEFLIKFSERTDVIFREEVLYREEWKDDPYHTRSDHGLCVKT